MTEAQPSHTGSAALPSKAKPNNITGVHSNNMLGQYHKHSMSTTSKVGIKSIRVQNSRVRTSCPSCHHLHISAGVVYIDNAEQALTLMKRLSRIKPQSSTPDSNISQPSPKVKQLSQCESFEQVATGCYMPISATCAPAECWMNQHFAVQPYVAQPYLGSLFAHLQGSHFQYHT